MNSGRFISNLLFLVFLASQVTLAQVTTGTIMGTVSDPTGAVIPGTGITVRNIGTGISRIVTTDAAGRYRAPQLGLGSYEVTAEAAGFQSVVRSGITLTVGREAVVDFTLQVGAVAERITVTGEAPLIETTNATVSGLVDERTMRDLPLLGRSFGDLAATQPGVIANLEITSDADTAVYSGGGRASRRSIGGTRPSQSAYFLDGLEVSTPSEGTPVSSVLGQQLGVDSIREFTVLQSNYGAQYGRAAGGVVNAVTQAGTNEFHGTIFEFLRNEKLEARDYFQHPALGKAPLKRNQFGGSLGGPIQKDRTFFFLNYEAVRQRAGVPRVGQVYTPETRLGQVTGCPPGKATCSPEESITINTLAVNEDIKVFFPLLPLPNGDYDRAGTADYFSVPRWRASENYGIVRIDRQLADNDSLFGRLTIDRSDRFDDYELLVPEGFKKMQEGGYIIAGISETHIFSPTVLNTFRAGYTRRNDLINHNYSLRGEFFPQGHPDLDPRLSPVKGIPLGLWNLPQNNIYGGVGPSLAGPALFIDNTFDFDDSLLVNFGRHSITFGGTVKRYQTNTINEPWVYGAFSWQTLERFLTNRPFATQQLIGKHVPGLQASDTYRGWRQTYGAIYVQDDFQALPNLTLNLGLRWEGLRSPREVNGKLAILKDIVNDADFALLTKEDPLFTMRNGLKGFSPRVGLAWTPFADQKTVLRGGFGTFTEMPLVYIYQLALEAPPFNKRFTVNAPILKFPFPFEDETLVSASGEPLTMPLDVKMPYTMQWTLSLERQFGETFVVKTNYVGTRGLNIFMVYNPNQKPTQIVNGRHFTPADAQVPNPNFTAFRYVAPVVDMHYHAGQLVVEKRFSSGLGFNTSYTLSRNIDTGAGAGTKCAEAVAGTNSFAAYNSRDFAGDKGLSPIHVKHNLIISYTYELPFGVGRRWGSQWPTALNYLLGGWMFNGIHSIRSGLPYYIGMTPRTSRCVAQSCPERPDLIPGGNNNPTLDNWIPEKYFDPSQFVLPPLGFFGNLGRHTAIRPGLSTWNFSLAKSHVVGETVDVEFRAEFFNFANHPNFSSPGASIFRNFAGDLDPRVGRITALSSPMREMQFGLRLTF